MVRRASIDITKPFSNGTFIVNSEMEQIDPASPEGQVIEGILNRQKADRAANAAQTAKVEDILGKDINNDGVIGTGKKRRKRKKKSIS